MRGDGADGLWRFMSGQPRQKTLQNVWKIEQKRAAGGGSQTVEDLRTRADVEMCQCGVFCQF